MKPFQLLPVIMKAMICHVEYPKPELNSFSINNSIRIPKVDFFFNLFTLLVLVAGFIFEAFFQLYEIKLT